MSQKEDEKKAEWLLRANETIVSLDHKKQMLVMMQYFAQTEGEMSETRFMLLINAIKRHSFSFFLIRQERILTAGKMKYIGYGLIEVYVAGTFVQVEVVNNVVQNIIALEKDEVIERNYITVLTILKNYGFIAQSQPEPTFFIIVWADGRKVRSESFIKKQVKTPESVNLYHKPRDVMTSSLETKKEVKIIVSLESGKENIRAVTDERNSTIAKYIPDASEFAISTPRYPVESHVRALRKNESVMNVPLLRWLTIQPMGLEEMREHLWFLKKTIHDLMEMDIRGRNCASFEKWKDLGKVTGIVSRAEKVDSWRRGVEAESRRKRGFANNQIDRELQKREIELERPKWSERTEYIDVKLLKDVPEDEMWNPSESVQWWLAMCINQKSFMETTLSQKINPSRTVLPYTEDPYIHEKEEVGAKTPEDEDEPTTTGVVDDTTEVEDMKLDLSFLKPKESVEERVLEALQAQIFSTTVAISDLEEQEEDELKKGDPYVRNTQALIKMMKERLSSLETKKMNTIAETENPVSSQMTPIQKLTKNFEGFDLEAIFKSVPNLNENQQSLEIVHEGMEELTANKKIAFQRRHFSHPFWEKVLSDPSVNRRQLIKENVPNVDEKHIMSLMRWVLDYTMELNREERELKDDY
jgi:hypothetical protein